MTPSMWIASLAWVLLVSGYAFRRNRGRHVPLMVSGIVMDITLVLYLQLTRSAIQTALSFDLRVLQQLHIAASTCALILYFPVVFFGVKLLRGRASAAVRRRHIRLAKCALLFRTLGFGFMFSMWR